MKLNFPVAQQPGKVVLNVQNVSKHYGEKKVLQKVNLEVERGTKQLLSDKMGRGSRPWQKLLSMKLILTGM